MRVNEFSSILLLTCWLLTGNKFHITEVVLCLSLSMVRLIAYLFSNLFFNSVLVFIDMTLNVVFTLECLFDMKMEQVVIENLNLSTRFAIGRLKIYIILKI